MNTYDIGDLVRVTATFAVADVLTNPTTIRLRVRAPAASDYTEYEGVGAVIKQASTGSFYADLDITAAGKWRYKWLGTGAAQGAEAGEFSARRNSYLD